MEAVKLSLNLQNCEIPAGCANFGELVSYMEEQQIPQDEVITRIIIDGSDVSSERELELATEPLSEFEIVEFYSARTLDLARQSMQDATELLPALQADLPNVATELRGGIHSFPVVFGSESYCAFLQCGSTSLGAPAEKPRRGPRMLN